MPPNHSGPVAKGRKEAPSGQTCWVLDFVRVLGLASLARAASRNVGTQADLSAGASGAEAGSAEGGEEWLDLLDSRRPRAVVYTKTKSGAAMRGGCHRPAGRSGRR
jgi:hypothetical protein